jgi:Domain of unknown function (DUF4265)
MAAVKVFFRLHQDEDGYPPISVESLWAQPGANPGECRIDNIPFFARDVTIGDVVTVREEEGCNWFESLARPSRNSLIRVIFFDPARVEKVTASLIARGCSTEYLRDYDLLAVSIPESVSLVDIQAYLRSEASAGTIDYEEPVLRQ